MQAETTAIPELARAEARLPRWMIAFTVAGSLVAVIAGQARLGAGFALGSCLAILNYHWLHQAVAGLMAAGQARPSRWVIAKFLIRYPLVFALVWVIYKTGWLPVMAILAGLFVPVVGVLIEAIIQLREGFASTGH